MVNSVLHLTLFTKYFNTECAIEYPSNVEVPRPNSSMITRLLDVARSSIALVSSNSTKKVDLFSRIRSDAPILVKIRSTGDN